MDDDATMMLSARKRLRVSASRKLAFCAAALAALLAAGYLFFVCTPQGQAFDNAGFAARSLIAGEAKAFDSELLGMVGRTTIAGCALAILAMAFLLRVPLVGCLAVAALFTALSGAEFLKHSLPRPALAPVVAGQPAYFSGNTYPSGHTTVGTSVALAFALLGGARARRWSAVAAGLVASSYGTAVYFMGWHRPSDAIGGILWSGLCFSMAAAVLARVHGHHPRPNHSLAAEQTALILAATLATLVVAIVIALPAPGPGQAALTAWSAAIFLTAFAVPSTIFFLASVVSWRSSRS